MEFPRFIHFCSVGDDFFFHQVADDFDDFFLFVVISKIHLVLTNLPYNYMTILLIEFLQNIKRRPPFYNNIPAGIVALTFDDNRLPAVVDDLADAGNVLTAFDAADIVHIDFQRRHLEAQGPAGHAHEGIAERRQDAAGGNAPVIAGVTADIKADTDAATSSFSTVQGMLWK